MPPSNIQQQVDSRIGKLLGETISTNIPIILHRNPDKCFLRQALSSTLPDDQYEQKNVYTINENGDIVFKPWLWVLMETKATNKFVRYYNARNPTNKFPKKEFIRQRTRYRNCIYKDKSRRKNQKK